VANRAEGVGVVRRKRWSESMAADIVRDAEHSGQNLKEFCQSRGLNYERVRRWRIRLESQPSASKRGRGFLSVQVVSDAAPASSSRSEAASGGVLEFEIGACVVRAHGDVSEATLVRALRAAREAARC
jgi:transposase-like protein